MNRFLMAFLLMACLPGLAWACRCSAPDAQSALDGADLVVVGKILEQAPLNTNEGSTAIIEVQQSWHSKSAAKIAVVTRTNCYFSWTPNKTYLLYLSKDEDGFYSTSRCHGNQPFSKAAERINWLNQHTKPL